MSKTTYEFGVNFENLTLREKVCQLMAPTARQFSDYGFDTEKYPIGFFWYAGAADKRPNEKTGETISAYEAIVDNYKGRVPLSITHDGLTGFAGINSVLRKLSIGASNDPDLAYRYGKVTAMQQIYNDVDLCLEPSCDLPSHPMSVAFGDFFSGIKEDCLSLCGAYVKGMQELGVAATIKHFPGMGSSYTNPHMARERTYLSKEEWDSSFGEIYKKLIDDGVMAIMTGHNSLPAYSTKDENGEYPPATVSYELTTELLKNKLGFNGLVVTDALVMGALDITDPAKVTADSFAAGSDVLLFPSLDAVDIIIDRLEKGEIPMSRLDDAMRRIYEYKEKMGLLDGSRNLKHLLDEDFAKRTHEERIRRGIVALTHNAPMFPIDKNKVKKICVCAIHCSDNHMDYTLFLNKLKAEGFEVDFQENVGLDHITVKEFQAKYDMIISCPTGLTATYVIPGHVAMRTIWGMRRIDRSKRCVVQFGAPKLHDVYFADEPIYVNAMDYSMATEEDMVQAVVDVLVGRQKATGKLPFKVETDEYFER